MKPGVFGERLKREREMRGVGLEEIASATRISTRFLLALENERWNDLPGGVFNRGFIRAVARYLGLDEEALIAEYALATDDRPEVAVFADSPVKPRVRVLPWVLLVLVVALGVGGWFAYQHYAPLIQAWWQPAPAPPAVTSPPRAPEDLSALPSASTAGGASQAAPSEAEMLQLKIDVGEVRTVQIIADGKMVFDGRMRPGQGRRFEAKESFEVSTNLAGKVFLELNGQVMPALGVPDAPGSIKLSRADLKKPQGDSY